jgi:hypothetical protein
MKNGMADQPREWEQPPERRTPALVVEGVHFSNTWEGLYTWCATVGGRYVTQEDCKQAAYDFMKRVFSQRVQEEKMARMGQGAEACPK